MEARTYASRASRRCGRMMAHPEVNSDGSQMASRRLDGLSNLVQNASIRKYLEYFQTEKFGNRMLGPGNIRGTIRETASDFLCFRGAIRAQQCQRLRL
jgi:hypothetical protein